MRPAAVALTGATGLIGQHLRPALAALPVVLLTRNPPQLGANERWRHLDLSGQVDLADLPEGTALCHLAYAMDEQERNVEDNRRLVAAVNAAPQVGSVLVMSSISVYGLGTDGTIDEATPCRPDNAYARAKLACEQVWREGLRPDCGLTVVRPATVVAPGGPALRALARDAVQRPWRGVLKRSLLSGGSVHFVSVGDVVAAVLLLLQRQAGDREVFLVADDDRPENTSYATMQDAVREMCGRRRLPGPPLPAFLTRPLGRALGRPLDVRRSFSSRALRSAGFTGAEGLDEAVRRALVQQFGPTVVRGRPCASCT